MEELRTLDAEAAQEKPLPKIWSRTAVFVFSFLLSTICGGIMMYQNLRATGRNKEAGRMLATGFIYFAVSISIALAVGDRLGNVSFIIPLTGAVILGSFFYNKYFPPGIKYRYRKIWVLLIITLVLIAGIVGFLFWAQSALRIVD